MIVAEKLVKWFFFGVIVATMPVWFAMIGRLFDGKPVVPVDLFGHGELLLFASTVSARGVGELIGGGERHRVKRVLCGSFALLVVLLAAGSLTQIARAQTLDTHAVMTVSLWLAI